MRFFLKTKIIILLFPFPLGIFLLLLFFSMLFPNRRASLDIVRLLYFQKPIISLISDISYRSKVNKSIHIAELSLEKYLLPGDLIFTSDTTSLGNAFIEGERKHIALYLWTPKQLKMLLWRDSPFLQKVLDADFESETPLILEGNFEGVQILALETISSKESLAAVRLTIPAKSFIEGIELAGTHLGKAYDFDFDLDNADRMYCSEVLYDTFLERGYSPQIEKGVFRDTLSPNTLMKILFEQQYQHLKPHLVFYFKGIWDSVVCLGKEELIKNIRE